MKKLPLLFIMLFSMFACERRSAGYEKLVAIDSLLKKTQNDSAFSALNKITVDDLENAEDTAYYALLKVQTYFRLYKDLPFDSLLDISLKYYKNSSDKKKLMRIYYYKGAVRVESEKFDSAVVYLKKGEMVAASLKDSVMQHHFYGYLTQINGLTKNYDMASKYANLAFEYASKMKNDAWIVEDMEALIAVYDRIGNEDSLYHYLKKMEEYIAIAPVELQPQLYADVGLSYFYESKYVEAEAFINKSLAVKPTSFANFILGAIRYEQAHVDEAWKLYEKAISIDDCKLNIKIQILQQMAAVQKERGDYKAHSELLIQVEYLKDSMANKHKPERVLQLQNDFEKAEADKKAQEHEIVLIVFLAALAVVLILGGVYHRRKSRIYKDEIAANRREIEQCLAEIKNYESSGDRHTGEINRLKKKVDELRDKQAKVLGHGKVLCESIMSGGTTNTWNRADFEAAVGYYRTIHSAEVADAESRYSSLTASNLFFLLLPHMGIADDDVPRVMNMSKPAIRTLRYRLKGKMKK